MLSDHYITFNSKCCVIYGICCCQAWEKKYLNTDYRRQLEPSYKLEEPCTDVFWFPLFSPEFCLELIDEVEHFGLWSGGKHDVSERKILSHTQSTSLTPSCCRTLVSQVATRTFQLMTYT